MKHKIFVQLAKQLQSLETEEDLYYLLKTVKQKFQLLVINPPYHIFQIPKRSGGLRTIEDPADELQKIQENLKKYLQALYHCHRTDAAYGYISRADDESEKKGILENALAHAKDDYLLNADLKDFFHFISWQKIYSNLTAFPFSVHHNVTTAICNICTLQGRLPMGAPTSPSLSNIAAYPFDGELTNFCKQENINYTRYVDDMSFSSNTAISSRQVELISSILVKEGYELNKNKFIQFNKGETKTITGLEIKDGNVKVADRFINEVQKEIELLKEYVLMQTRLHPQRPLDDLLAKPLQKINGALLFIASVHGEDYQPLYGLQKNLQKAVVPPADYESLHWLQIGYEIF